MALSGFAAACSAPLQLANGCGASGLSPEILPPMSCPATGGAPTMLRDDGGVQGCIELEREPDEHGGLRIPRQIVCPPLERSATGEQHD